MRKLADFEELENEIIQILRVRAIQGELTAADLILQHVSRSKRTLANWQSKQDKNLPAFVQKKIQKSV